MKIKCEECSFKNLEKSEFCQECGSSLRRETKSIPLNPIYKEIEAIEDVIFKPSKRGVSIKNIIIGVIILGTIAFGGLILLFLFSSDETSQTEPPTSTDPATFPISYLNIVDGEVSYDDAGESYFVGTLKNAYSKAARNVELRVDFYYDEALKKHFDTRNGVINNGAEANGAFSFEIPLNFYQQDQYWYVWKIEGADFGSK